MRNVVIFFLVCLWMYQIHAKNIPKDDDIKYIDELLEELERRGETKLKTSSKNKIIENRHHVKENNGMERESAIGPEIQAIYDELANFGPTDYVCGYRHHENGDNVDIHDVIHGNWPWHVQIRVCSPNDLNDCYICSGVLIGPMFAITSARCFKGKDYTTESVRIFIGQKTLSDKPDEGAIVKTPLKIYIREDYDDNTFDNDMALIYLPGIVMFDDQKDRVCINWDGSKPFDSQSTCFVTGWGTVFAGGSIDLQHSESPTIVTKECRDLSYWDSSDVTDNMFCAGHINGDNDACPQDYGSPLVCGDYAGRFTLAGLYSFGADEGKAGEECRTPGYPQVYSKISTFLPWVREIVLEETGIDVYNLISE
ncbi:trypsin-1-like [Saccoglossus kowalevskii]|uniref:Ovochymase-2-like n=1 Tax=Saccoglossus kowalevskii TaxID=10224 RepID=A0ABM0GZW4_SACKO|nr:PREDICTED: ovochymase-2-like [Saccoglossus kowalevskii]